MPTLLTASFTQKILKPREKFAHKGTFGHALLLAGSKGKMGAAVIASKACLRSGTGLLTVHTPSCGTAILQTSIPEAMVSEDTNPSFIADLPEDLHRFSAIGVGPGIGTERDTELLLHAFLDLIQSPIVVDADALNAIAIDKRLLAKLPENAILTPHPKEFERLIGNTWTNREERTEIQVQFSRKNKVIVVLKDAETVISTPDGKLFQNTTGNPGMAKGGSGDALTGMITAFLAQAYSPIEAAQLAVYLHGLAGDLAVSTFSEHALLVSDLIDFIPKAFQKIETFTPNGLFDTYKPKGFSTISPYLMVKNPRSYIAFLQKALFAEVIDITQDETHEIRNAILQIGESCFMISPANPPFEAASTSFYLYVNDVDSFYKHAIDNGATSIFEPADMPYQDRQAGIQDEEGIYWWISKRLVEKNY